MSASNRIAPVLQICRRLRSSPKGTCSRAATKNKVRRAKSVQSNVVPLTERFRFIKPDSDVVTGTTWRQAFGHSPGHICYHIESGGKQFLIFADTTNHYAVSLARPNWHCIFDMDAEATVSTRKRILDKITTEKIPVTRYHMPFPAVDYVDKTGADYRRRLVLPRLSCASAVH